MSAPTAAKENRRSRLDSGRRPTEARDMTTNRLTNAEIRRHARNVNLFLNRPRGTARIPAPDVAYESGRALVRHYGAEPTFRTAADMRQQLTDAGHIW